MKLSIGLSWTVLWAVLVGAACSTHPNAQPALETRVTHVLNGLHIRESVTSPPADTWSLEERMAHHGVPAVSIAVIHDGGIEWARAYGSAVSGSGRGVSERTLFQAASISKALTALATLCLADGGLLALDAPVNRYLRSWRLPDSDAGSADSVTIARLLAHMAGLNVPGFPGYEPGVAIPTPVEILDGTGPTNTPAIRIARTPGAGWSYSGGGYLVLQQVLEDVTGENFSSLLARLVLTPLRMERSTFQQPLPPDLAAGAAAGHHSGGEVLPGRWHAYPELAAAGLWTTPSDLARFALGVRAIATQSPDALLSDQGAAALTTPRFGSFSLGLLIRRNGAHAWFTHNGGNAGYRALMYAYLTMGEGAVVMTNSDDGMALASEIINSIALEYGWPGFVPEELQ